MHDELDRTGFRNWILDRVDMVTEYSLKARKQLGYWEMLLGASDQKLNTRYLNNFEYLGENIRLFESQEATLALRYAYGVFTNFTESMIECPFILSPSSGNGYLKKLSW